MKGELFALGAAVSWATAVILFKRSGSKIPPVSLNLFKTVLSLALLIVTLLIMGHPIFPELPARDYWLLIGSGIIGISLADTLFFYGLHYLGASLSSIVECLYSPSIIVMAYFFFPNEEMTLGDVAGLALVLSSLLTVATSVPARVAARSGAATGSGAVSGGDTRIDMEPQLATEVREHRRDLLRGVACGAAAMVTLALGVMMFKPVAEHQSGVWVSAMRTLPAVVPLAVFPMLHRARRAQLLECFRPSRVWWTLVPGSILGTYVSLICWILGFKYATASRAAILNQSNTIFVLILAALFLGERMTVRKLIAVMLGLSGVTLVTLL